MATWEDGPEYAPLERPTGFDLPDVAPLSTAPPPVDPSAGAPLAQPQFRPAVDAGPPLTAIVPGPQEQRDPHEPFAVARSTMTSQTSAWAGAHWGRDGQPPAGVDPAWGPPPESATPAAAPSFPPPTGAPVQPGPGAVPGSLPASGSPFPAPGSVEWFGPSPAGRAGERPPQPMTAAEGLTIGYIIVLLACLVYPFAPIFFLIGTLLSRRVRLARHLIPKFAAGAAVLWALIALMNLIGAQSFGDWWWGIATWALILGLVLLIVSWIVVKVAPYPPAPPGPPTPWA